jgi:hypothetical protein
MVCPMIVGSVVAPMGEGNEIHIQSSVLTPKFNLSSETCLAPLRRFGGAKKYLFTRRVSLDLSNEVNNVFQMLVDLLHASVIQNCFTTGEVSVVSDVDIAVMFGACKGCLNLNRPVET